MAVTLTDAGGPMTERSEGVENSPRWSPSPTQEDS
jgi:hypothetical protein